MNLANETLKSIRHQKSLITKAYKEAMERLEKHYQADMETLNKEEKELMKQFKDIPMEERIK